MMRLCPSSRGSSCLLEFLVASFIPLMARDTTMYYSAHTRLSNFCIRKESQDTRSIPEIHPISCTCLQGSIALTIYGDTLQLRRHPGIQGHMSDESSHFSHSEKSSTGIKDASIALHYLRGYWSILQDSQVDSRRWTSGEDTHNQ